MSETNNWNIGPLPFETGVVLRKPGTDRYLESEDGLFTFSSEAMAREYCDRWQIEHTLEGVQVNCQGLLHQEGRVVFINEEGGRQFTYPK